MLSNQKTQQDEYWMRQVFELAHKASSIGEVPIGALLVLDDTLIAKSYNQVISLIDPTAHAEILVLRQAAKELGNYRLLNTTLYTNLEPCSMCAAALVHARVKRLVYAAADNKLGLKALKISILQNPALNHRLEVTVGCLASEAKTLLQDFFRSKR